jgi:FK506-binding nuclear protein
MDRIKDVDTDEEEAPKLTEAKTDAKRGKNKRPADDDAEGLDEMIAKEGKAAPDGAKLSKKQQKKMKNNKGEAVAAWDAAKENSTPNKADKKVQFAKTLEQGPTGAGADTGSKQQQKQPEKKSSLEIKVVQGVTIDDRTIGKGRTAKSGDKVSLRYIGKLQSNGKVFDGKSWAEENPGNMK